MAMYQGPIQAAESAGTEEAPILRQLRWTDLVARIAASRDQRVVPVIDGDETQASFAAFHTDRADGEGNGQHPVNRDALSHGKFTRLSQSEAANSAGLGDRETQ